MNFFDQMTEKLAPLADRMRPKTLSEFIGQEHLLSSGSLLTRAINADKLGSCIFYGSPGTGKTTLANIIAKTTNCFYESLNAVSSGVADAKRVIETAKLNLAMYGKKTYLFLDECHRWNKSQSDCVLSAIEKGEIIFIGSTTENPYVSMTKAIVSRCRIFEFKKLTSTNIVQGILGAISDKENGLGTYNIEIKDDALAHISMTANGDLRNALNALELAFLTTNPNNDNKIIIDLDTAEQSCQRKAISVDEGLYYDILSAFCKSLRGSDADAGVYYASRLIEAGVDPLLICRRLIVHSAEDVGMADPNALTIAVNAMTAMEKIGMPEGFIPLTQAIIYVCLAPKSNSVINAVMSAGEAAKNGHDDIPTYLMDNSFKADKDKSYKYPHDYGGYVKQQYLPHSIKDMIFYKPSKIGFENNIIIRKTED